MIDLEKITPKQFLRETVDVNILGVIQKQEIKNLTGEPRLRYWALSFSERNDEATKERVMIALVSGAGLTPENAVRLIELDWDAATSLAGKVHLLTKKMDDAIEAEKIAAEKNLNPEASTDTAI